MTDEDSGDDKERRKRRLRNKKKYKRRERNRDMRGARRNKTERPRRQKFRWDDYVEDDEVEEYDGQR